jgi:formate hydrogenlyase subunit 3/multisubunit Na+/H+ antiporter MnhD subunit
MTETFFEIISKTLSFEVLTVLPALMIFTMGIVTIIYNKLLSNSITRSFLTGACIFFSILAILSQNYILTFIALESLSGVCFLLILISKKVSRRVAISYFVIHAFAGVLMLVCIMMNWSESKTFQITKISNIVSLKEIILLSSLIINTAMFPFLNWYTKTYSRTDSFSLIILSVITTKTSFFILWKIIPGSGLLFDIGLITLLSSMFLALLTKNVIKFLLLISISSTGFATMAVSYNGFLITEGITNAINFQLVWYMASSAFAIGGFLTLYGFIANQECSSSSFASMKHYFQEYGSSIHFVIPAIIFGLCVASFPLTASFFAKGEIIKFFVEEKTFYVILKSVNIVFIIFAIKLITPVFHSVEFFMLDKRGNKLAIILYIFVGILMFLNLLYPFFVKTKMSFFGLSVEFFTFVAYTLIAIATFFLLDFILKITNAKYLIEIAVYDFNFFKIRIFFFFKLLKAKIHILLDSLTHKRKDLKEVLVFSKISPSASIVISICLMLLFFTSNYVSNFI